MKKNLLACKTVSLLQMKITTFAETHWHMLAYKIALTVSYVKYNFKNINSLI